MTEPSQSKPIDAPSTNDRGAASVRDAVPAQTPSGPRPVAAEGHWATRKRRLLIGGLGASVLAVALAFGIPWIRQSLNTVSTDDAYVNGHVTFVAPRVGGQISRVLVDDNYRVQKGELLAELDKEPFQIAVSQKRAAVDNVLCA